MRSTEEGRDIACAERSRRARLRALLALVLVLSSSVSLFSDFAAAGDRGRGRQRDWDSDGSRWQPNRDRDRDQSDNNRTQTPQTQPNKSEAATNAKSDNSEGDKQSGAGADSKSKQANRGGEGSDAGAPASAPATVSEWLDRLAGDKNKQQAIKPATTTKPASTPATTATTSAAKPPSATTAVTVTTAAPATTAKSAQAKKATTTATTPTTDKKQAQAPRPSAPLDPFPAGPIARDILAINPSAATLARAQSLGFTIEPSVTLPQLGFSVQKLVPPITTDAVQARELLGREFGPSRFAINQTYRPLRLATSNEQPKPASAVPAGTSGCTPDRCYGLRTIGWQTELHSCSRRMPIGIIDTMVDRNHPALQAAAQANRLATRNFASGGRRPAESPHGTGIVALLAGTAQSGTPGLIPEANFLAADIFHADGNGQPVADTVSLLRALDWMEEKAVKVLNMSVAGPHDPLMERAIEKLAVKGTVFVAAAGNEGPAAPPVYPAAYKSVIAVTAVGRDLRGYRRANRGDYIDAAAPGVDVWTAAPDGKENFQSGTSFAVPFATAVIASVYNDIKIKSKEAILAALEYKDLGLPGHDPVYGRGLMLAPKTCGGNSATVATAVVSTPAAPPASAASIPAPPLAFGFAAGKP